MLAGCSVNQILLSGPVVMSYGKPWPPLRPYSVKLPLVVTLAILLPAFSVNHTRLSGPSVMLSGLLLAVGTVYSVIPLSAVGSQRVSSISSAGWQRGGQCSGLRRSKQPSQLRSI